MSADGADVARDATDEADAAKPDVNGQAERAAMLSHDIRAAVSDVIGGLRLIDTEAMSEDVRLQLERVRSSGETLARLLEDALNSLFEGETVSFVNRTQINLGRFLHDLESRWTGRAAALKVGFRVRTGQTTPSVIQTDRTGLERIVSNLLSNALKYVECGQVSLSVDVLEEDVLAFRVLDDGPGFSGDALTRLFQPSGRPQDSTKPGTGLGLHIAKDLADRLGGRLEVRNAPDGGADVALLLPADAWRSSAHPTPDGNLPDLTGLRVLVAEDNETNQLLTSQMLAAMGAETQIAPDGIEALNWFEREEFDLGLIDIEMPRLNGIEVIRAMRARPDNLAEMPLVALTAYVLRANREAIYAAGADGIVAKPIMSLEGFGRSLAGYLSLKIASLPETKEAPLMDSDRLARLLEIAGPADAGELLRRLAGDLTRVRDNMNTALQEPDIAALRAETHVLISLAGAVGAERLHQLAKTMNADVHRQDAASLVASGREAELQIDLVLSLLERETTKRNSTA